VQWLVFMLIISFQLTANAEVVRPELTLEQNEEIALKDFNSCVARQNSKSNMLLHGLSGVPMNRNSCQDEYYLKLERASIIERRNNDYKNQTMWKQIGEICGFSGVYSSEAFDALFKVKGCQRKN
jgi:hypothetical protein